MNNSFEKTNTAPLPLVAIVGRPNVGKSTLFNRLVGRRLAVVENTPGVTRDRLYAEAEWLGVQFSVVDTGGMLFSQEDPLIEQVRTQAEVAITEADVIVFMTDAMDGLTPADQELADLLRVAQKPIFIVPNKTDHEKHEQNALEFHAISLGEVMPVSALHGVGVAELLDKVIDVLPRWTTEVEEDDSIKVAIVGRPNVGKSSLVNAVTGENRVIVSNIPGTTRDAVDTRIEWNDQKIILIDTAGLRRPGKIQGTLEYYTALRTERAIERADVVLPVVDSGAGLTDGDKRAASIAHDHGKAIVWVANKWDIAEPPDGKLNSRTEPKTHFAGQLKNEMPSTAYAPAVFVSALLKQGMKPLLDTITDVADNHAFRIGTGVLNRIIRDALFDKPAMRKGEPLKIYYATMVSTKPPTITLFVNRVDRLHLTYKRYLENQIRKHFPMEGTQLRIYVRESSGREHVGKRGK